jgi:hypothetical protein
MPVQKGPGCVGREMELFSKGQLHSGKSGKVVTNPEQAKAIALSVCGQSKYSEVLQSIGFSADVSDSVVEIFAEIDWAKQFRTGKGPGPERQDNYKTGKAEGVSPTKAQIGKVGPRGDMGRQKENTETEMMSPVAYPKGPGNPQGGSSKEVFGLRMLG